MKCLTCGIEFDGRADAKYCSPKCRKEAFFNRSIKRSNGTDNVIIAERIIEPDIEFKFTVSYNRQPGDDGYDHDVETARKTVRTEKYWYEVPIAAVPVLQKGWPEMPEYMNGRQYFLWWKNEFKTKDGNPVISSPFPERADVRYEMGGEGSRKWGA